MRARGSQRRVVSSRATPDAAGDRKKPISHILVAARVAPSQGEACLEVPPVKGSTITVRSAASEPVSHPLGPSLSVPSSPNTASYTFDHVGYLHSRNAP
jgi:hypothetical protein